MGPEHRLQFNNQTFYLNVSRYTEPTGRTRAVEVFVSTDSLAETELATAVAKLLSHILRFDADPMGALAKLKSVSGPDVAWVEGKMYRGLVSLIAHKLEAYILSLDAQQRGPNCDCHQVSTSVEGTRTVQAKAQALPGAMLCPSCNEVAVVREDGCEKCYSCGAGKCS